MHSAAITFGKLHFYYLTSSSSTDDVGNPMKSHVKEIQEAVIGAKKKGKKYVSIEELHLPKLLDVIISGRMIGIIRTHMNNKELKDKGWSTENIDQFLSQKLKHVPQPKPWFQSILRQLPLKYFQSGLLGKY